MAVMTSDCCRLFRYNSTILLRTTVILNHAQFILGPCEFPAALSSGYGDKAH